MLQTRRDGITFQNTKGDTQERATSILSHNANIAHWPIYQRGMTYRWKYHAASLPLPTKITGKYIQLPHQKIKTDCQRSSRLLLDGAGLEKRTPSDSLCVAWLCVPIRQRQCTSKVYWLVWWGFLNNEILAEKSVPDWWLISWSS